MIQSKDFVSSAQFRPEDKLSEVEYRNSASRAYYGAYHACVELTKKKGLLDFEPNHATIIAALISSGDEACLEISEKLKQCKKRRQYADYNLRRTFSYHEAKGQLRKAKEILNDIENELAKKSA